MILYPLKHNQMFILCFTQLFVSLQKISKSPTMNQEERLRKHSAKYLPCFVDTCPRHENCLHWLTGKYTTDTSINILCVNPVNPNIKANKCELYREAVTGIYARGMMHFFEMMPRQIECNIKGRLIGIYSRKRFYEYRNGVRLISPEQQQQIARICQQEGWTGEMHYDGWEEDFLW